VPVTVTRAWLPGEHSREPPLALPRWRLAGCPAMRDRGTRVRVLCHGGCRESAADGVERSQRSSRDVSHVPIAPLAPTQLRSKEEGKRAMREPRGTLRWKWFNPREARFAVRRAKRGVSGFAVQARNSAEEDNPRGTQATRKARAARSVVKPASACRAQARAARSAVKPASACRAQASGIPARSPKPPRAAQATRNPAERGIPQIAGNARKARSRAKHGQAPREARHNAAQRAQRG
jgi:hypothetical protein